MSKSARIEFKGTSTEPPVHLVTEKGSPREFATTFLSVLRFNTAGGFATRFLRNDDQSELFETMNNMGDWGYDYRIEGDTAGACITLSVRTSDEWDKCHEMPSMPLIDFVLLFYSDERIQHDYKHFIDELDQLDNRDEALVQEPA